MENLNLIPIDTTPFEIYANPHDVLHDLHQYVQYMSSREVKRMTRSNEIPKADIKRLVKRLANPAEIMATLDEFNKPGWVYFIDHLARQLGLVSYDIKGEYRGYTSHSPSFIKNYIIVSAKNYHQFLAYDPAEQEQRIFKAICNYQSRDRYDRYTENEFYETGVLGCLDAFQTWGAATGVMPSLDFTKIRKFLFDLLQHCQPGAWYSVASLVAFLKEHHPYFIIPAKVKPDRWGEKTARYGNFYDGENVWHNREHIPDEAPDGFERVEGRYIERFFENIPLTLRFVELAYDPQPYARKFYPMIDYLKGFRLTDRFFHLMNDTAQPPKVIVQPNFEIIVESAFYPAQILLQLEKLAEPATASVRGTPVSVTTLMLKRERVAAALVNDPDLDVGGLLTTLSAAPLPPNIATEINEWSGHAEMFTLYEGFGLLESRLDISGLETRTTQVIGPHLRLVDETAKVQTALEKKGLAPIPVQQQADEFIRLPNGVHSVFPTAVSITAAEPQPIETVAIQKITTVTLQFPHEAVFDAFRRALAEQRVPVQADAGTLCLSFAETYWPVLEKVIQELRSRYTVQIKAS